MSDQPELAGELNSPASRIAASSLLGTRFFSMIAMVAA